MGIKIEKKSTPIECKLDHLVTGSVENMDKEDKLVAMKVCYNQAVQVVPDYDNLKKEMNSYSVNLPSDPSISDLSEINKTYAIVQGYLSRVTAIEMVSIDNANRWERLKNYMLGYIDDKESELLSSEEMQGKYPNTKMQQASVRNKLTKEYNALMKIQDSLSDADSFRQMVDVKKKDLVLILTNLSRQVKALSLEHSLNS